MRLVEYAPGRRLRVDMGDPGETPPELVSRGGDPSLFGRFRSGR